MTMGLSQFDEHFPAFDLEQIDNAWGLTPINFWGASQPPMRVDAIYLSSTDTVDRYLQFWSTAGGANRGLLGTILVPALSGTNGVQPVIDAIPLLFPTQLCYLGDHFYGLAVAPVVAVTAGKYIYLSAVGGLL